MESEVRTVDSRTGISVPCFVQGQLGEDDDDGGAPLVLLHAWGESWRSFERLIAALPEFVIVAPDLRGHGGADKPESGYALPDIAEDMSALLEALGIKKAHVVGSSSGGYVAQQLAVTHPDLVTSLVLVGSPLSLQGRPSFADEVDTLTDPVSEAWVRDSLSWYRLFHTVPPSYIEARVQDGLAMPASIWKASLRGLFEAVPPTETGTISAPTLILWGAHDHLVPRHHQETLAGRIPGAQLKIYEETGHLVLWECPDRVAEDVKAFIQD
ncbi:alpha/beta hydrolase [Paenarthrobacter sp. NPDC089322]|uniref:alpha/beta fold hydrolase n=1 Tax=Paenarthrobacter sp. NPDC089322 TaxID=3155065 RepID=UPI0034459C57